MAESGEMAREMERVCRALEQTSVHLAGVDQADSARQLDDRVSYSPLRTAVDQARTSAGRVLRHLRKQGGRDAFSTQ